MPFMLTDDVLSYISRSVLCWLATASAEGMPNVSPKEIFAAYNRQTMLIANIASPNSAQNIRENSQVCLSFVDVFVQKGYKLQGVGELVLPTEARYSELEVPLVKLTGGMFPIKNIISIQVTYVSPIVAPGYRFRPGTTEDSQLASAMKTYGVCTTNKEKALGR